MPLISKSVGRPLGLQREPIVGTTVDFFFFVHWLNIGIDHYFNMISSDLQTSLTILMIGMMTVFLILFIVIYVARFVIYLTNYFAEDEEALIRGSTVRAHAISDIPAQHMQVITQTVEMLTDGKARIIDIQKSV